MEHSSSTSSLKTVASFSVKLQRPGLGIMLKSDLRNPVVLNPHHKRIPVWMVVKIMVPFWVLNIILHLVFREPKRGP